MNFSTRKIVILRLDYVDKFRSENKSIYFYQDCCVFPGENVTKVSFLLRTFYESGTLLLMVFTASASFYNIQNYYWEEQT